MRFEEIKYALNIIGLKIDSTPRYKVTRINEDDDTFSIVDRILIPEQECYTLSELQHIATMQKTLSYLQTKGKYAGRTWRYILEYHPSYVLWCYDNITLFKLYGVPRAKVEELVDWRSTYDEVIKQSSVHDPYDPYDDYYDPQCDMWGAW